MLRLDDPGLEGLALTRFLVARVTVGITNHSPRPGPAQLGP